MGSTSRSTVKVVGTILLTVILLTSVACLVVSLMNMKIASDIAEKRDYGYRDIMRDGLGEACSGTQDCGDTQQCCCEHRPAKEKGYCLWRARCTMEMKSVCRSNIEKPISLSPAN